jgi:hypothetical protein
VRLAPVLALIGILAAAEAGTRGVAGQAGEKLAVTIEPVGAILDAFRAHPVVMLGHPHGIEQRHRFHLSLIRDPRFPNYVNDIVEECGNARHQERIDRFVSGQEVPYSELRQVWEDTISAAPNCDQPMYEELYRTVRDINRTLPRERRIRVVLGDVPIDWRGVRTFADLVAWDAQRYEHMANVVQREVLAKGGRALVLYGDMHAQRKNERVNFESADNVAARLERDGTTTVFTVWSNIGPNRPDVSQFQADVRTWVAPRLALLRGTVLGTRDFADYFTSDGRFTLRDGRPQPIARERWAPMRMQEQFDAVLYLGPQSSMTLQRLAPERCSDSAYMAMRTGRMALLPGGQAQVERLREYCAASRR